MKQGIVVDADKIHILRIRTISGNISCEDEEQVKNVKAHHFEFQLSNGVNLAERVIGIQLVVEIEAADKDMNRLPIKGTYKHEIVFRVDNLEDFVEAESKELDASFGSTIVGIAYSTIRGLIYNRSQGTSLKSVILPVVAPLKLMGVELEHEKVEPKNEKEKQIVSETKGTRVEGKSKTKRK
jgi:hypothetical protein